MPATGHVFIATSLDGYIARADGGLDWLPADLSPDDSGYSAFYGSVDGLIMGRNTFRTVQAFGGPWPYDRPVIVVSRSLTAADVTIPGADITLAPGTEAAWEQADRRGWGRIYLDGGAIIRCFLAAGRVQDMVITQVPVLLGDGIPLFAPGDTPPCPLCHAETRVLPGGLVQTRYTVSGGS